MREILFRGRTLPKEAGEFNDIWVYGDLIQCGNRFYIHPKSNNISVAGDIGKTVVMHEVQPKTVGQFTGFLDRCGTKVFEEDCIGHELNVVEMLNGDWCINGDRPLQSFIKGQEVIGNIHNRIETRKRV